MHQIHPLIYPIILTYTQTSTGVSTLWRNLGRVQLEPDNVPLSTSGYQHCSLSWLTHTVLILTLPCSNTANDHESPMSAGAEYKQKWKHTHSQTCVFVSVRVWICVCQCWKLRVEVRPSPEILCGDKKRDCEKTEKKERGVCFPVAA